MYSAKQIKIDFSYSLLHSQHYKSKMSLRLSSIAHEYYLGDLQGTLQYKKTKDDILNIDNIKDDDSIGFTLEEHSVENKARVLPHTKNPEEYKVLLIMKRNVGEEIWLKAALQHKETGLIALMTATNGEENITNKGNRPLKSNDKEWFVGFYRMAAPMCFWKELRNRLQD
jgi:hypothetical protein